MKDLLARIERKVDRDGPIPERTPELGPCWIWTGGKNSAGYGMVSLGGRKDGTALVHRVMYEMFVGPISDGLVVDHRCDVSVCVRPKHLQAITQQENVLRGANEMVALHHAGVCKRGHDLEVHAYVKPNGDRQCGLCMKMRKRGEI